MFKTILRTHSWRAQAAAAAVGSVSPLLSFLTENKVKVTGSLIDARLLDLRGRAEHQSPPPTIRHHWNWLTAHYRLSAWAKPLLFPGSEKYILCN